MYINFKKILLLFLAIALIIGQLFLFISSSRVSAFPGIIFEDGFESGDFSAWTGIQINPTIVTSPVHHGTYSMLVNAANEGVYKDFSAISTLYGRTYFRFTDFPSSGNAVGFFGLANGITAYIFASLYNDAGTVKWRLTTYTTSGWETITISSPLPSLNTWYSVELKWQANTIQGGRMWIDGSSVATITGTTTNNQMNRVHVYQDGLGNLTYYVDCAKIADTYIGPHKIFKDGFESGDFSAWTNTWSGGEDINTTNAIQHHGSWSAKADITSTGWTSSNAQSYKSMSSLSLIFLRAYVRFDTLPASVDENEQFLETHDGNNPGHRWGIRHDGTAVRFSMRYRNGSSWINAFDTTLTPQVNT